MALGFSYDLDGLACELRMAISESKDGIYVTFQADHAGEICNALEAMSNLQEALDLLLKKETYDDDD